VIEEGLTLWWNEIVFILWADKPQRQSLTEEIRMGKDLYELLIVLSGLPEDYAREKFSELIVKQGFQIETLTLDQVRELLADSLQEMVLSA